MKDFFTILKPKTNPTFFKAFSAYAESGGNQLTWDDHPVLHHLDVLAEMLLDAPPIDEDTHELAHRFLIETADQVLSSPDKDILTLQPVVWVVLLHHCADYDHRFPLYLNGIADAHKSKSNKRRYYEFIKCLHRFFEIDREVIRKALLKTVASQPFSSDWNVIRVLDQHLSALELVELTQGMLHEPPDDDEPIYKKLLRTAYKHIDNVGGIFLRNALPLSYYEYGFRKKIINSLLQLPEEHQALAKDILLEAAAGFSTPDKTIFWKTMLKHPQFETETMALIHGSAATLRDLAAKQLTKSNPNKARELAAKLIGGKKVNERLGAIAILTRLGKESVPVLEQALEKEKSTKAIDLIEKFILSQNGSSTKSADTTDKSAASPDALIATITADKKLKLPKIAWLDAGSLALIDPSGKAFPASILTYLIKWQSKHKEIEACPQIAELLPEIQHANNHSFAFSLLEQWLSSKQEAKDRWVLTLAGLLGDDTIIPDIHASIHRWAKAQRKELAACAAKALGLLGSDSALTILDELSQKYRQKGANIGRAGGDAFLAVARTRGLTLDQLRDDVTPDLGFDSDGNLLITEDGASLTAQLQSDFSLLWFNQDTGKTTKNPPAKTPAPLKKRITSFRKHLRETVSNLSTRMERALTTQRRWDADTWSRLFQDHPLLQHFSSQLIWASYSGGGQVTRTFRRYTNGVLSDHTGEMFDLESHQENIGILHPCELSTDQITSWLEHLERHQVTPPFLQLEREIHRADPRYHNHTSLGTVAGKTCYATTLLGRMDRFGWLRGSTMEGGNVYSIYMEYPTHGLELILTLDGMEMGALAYSMPRLSNALFIKAGSVERGSYVDDVPKANDDCVLPLGKIPEVIYSEAVNSLKALTGE